MVAEHVLLAALSSLVKATAHPPSPFLGMWISRDGSQILGLLAANFGGEPPFS